MKIFFYQTDLGRIGIAEKSRMVSHLLFENTVKDIPVAEITETPLIKEAAAQLNAYLSGRKKDFDLPLMPAGTPFMQKVWKALQTIPYGKTVSYKDIAVAIGSPQACRAVGLANNKNPLPIFIPCHRVIGKNGNLIGYGGGLSIKKKLLSIEGALREK